jgi:hypothetical protein
MIGNKKTKLLSAGEIERAIDEVVAIASKEEIDVALCGGAALQLFGSDRFTKDVDFVASRVPGSVEIKEQLPFGGAAASSPTGTPIKIIVRDDHYTSLYRESLASSGWLGDVRIRVIPSEYLAAMKLAARRMKDEQDLTMLIRRLDALDLRKTRDIIRRHMGHYAVDKFNSYVDEVEWRMYKGEDE